MKKIISILIVTVALFSCKEVKKEVASEETTKPEIKLYTFSGGTVMVNNLELFSQDSTYQGQSKEFADPYYVISHPKGTLMWDAGLPEGLVAAPEPITPPGGAFTISRKDSVNKQLKLIGMTPDDIDYLALSHTHFDHSGHANAISNGSVIIKSMPGHTPGHQVLFLDMPENGPTLLTGDLYHLYENREHRRVPSFNFDVAQTLSSMDSFEAFAKEKNAKVYLQHQKEDFNKMPKAPKYLK